ncbi:MAG TPA: hypothetical protein VGM41_07590 [Chitinophagaceae bacterium]|jgi:hypothetical protein
MKNALSRLHQMVDAVEPSNTRRASTPLSLTEPFDSAQGDKDPTPSSLTSDADVEGLLGSWAADCGLSMKYLLEQSVRMKNNERFSFLIHSYQCSFVAMLDRVGQYQRVPHKAFLQPVYQLLVSSLMDCLRQLEVRYRSYFDVEEKAADISREQLRVGLAPRWEVLVVRFQQRGVEAELVKVMSGFWEHFSDHEQTDWRSFHDLAYVEELVERLEDWVEGHYGDATEALVLELLSLNFNTTDFIAYCMKDILRKAEDAVSPKDKIEKLCRYRHELYYLPVKTQLVYSSKRPVIRMLLDSWLRDEIGLLESRFSLLTTGTSSAKMVWEEDKIDTVFTVAQLAVWLRGAFEVGIFPGENIERLCRKLALLFRTKCQEHISPGSIQTKAYTITEKTKEVVNGYIIKMFNQIKGY